MKTQPTLLKLIGYTKQPLMVVPYLKSTPIYSSLTDEDIKALKELFPTAVTISSNFVSIDLPSYKFDTFALACSLYIKYRLSLLKDSSYLGMFTQAEISFRWVGVIHPKVEFESSVPMEDCTESIGKNVLFTAIKKQLVTEFIIDSTRVRLLTRFQKYLDYTGLVIIQGKKRAGFVTLI